jgi:hypothetical protein
VCCAVWAGATEQQLGQLAQDCGQASLLLTRKISGGASDVVRRRTIGDQSGASPLQWGDALGHFTADEAKMIAQWIGIAGVMFGLALLHWADRVRP